MPGTGPSSSKPAPWEQWESGTERRKERSLRSQLEVLTLRLGDGAGLSDDGVLGPEEGELLENRTTKLRVPEEGER